MEKGRLSLLTPKNSVLLLVDYQPSMFKGVGSGDRNLIKRSAVAAAKAARILKVPTVLSAINPAGNGEFISEITNEFPGKEVIVRKVPSFDGMEDERVLAEIKKLGRKKIVIGGLWTSMCFCYTALHGLKIGLEVYGLMDAGGDAFPEAHHYGVKRMIQAGVIPITWESLTSEWMHDWANPKSGELFKEVYSGDAILGL